MRPLNVTENTYDFSMHKNKDGKERMKCFTGLFIFLKEPRNIRGTTGTKSLFINRHFNKKRMSNKRCKLLWVTVAFCQQILKHFQCFLPNSKGEEMDLVISYSVPNIIYEKIISYLK